MDASIEKAAKEITAFHDKQREDRTRLKVQMTAKGLLAASTFFGSAVGALLLLILRDFLSALIDTAANTGATVEVLERIRKGE